MRTQKVKKEEVKNQLLKGISPEAIAKYQGCSRQYISLVRGDYEKEGVVFPATKPGRKPQKVASIKTEPLKNMELTQLDEIAMTMYKRAMEYPELKAEINRLKNRVASIENDNKVLRDDGQQKVERVREFENAKRLGQIGKGD